VATTNQGQLTAGTAGGISAVTASITLPRNTLCLAAVVTLNTTTPANLATPAISGWDVVGSVLTSNTRRLTLLRRMVATDTTGTLTITGNGLSQDAFDWAISWIGGVSCDGTNGSGAVGQIVTNTSASTPVTTLSIVLAAFSSVLNGGYAAFQSSQTGAMAPQGAWSETFDTNETAGRLETQFIATNTSAVGVNTGSGLLMGIAIEIVAPSDAIVLGTISTGTLGFSFVEPSQPPFTTQAFVGVHMQVGKTYYLFVAANPTASGNLVNGVTTDGHLVDIPWTSVQSFGFDTIAAPIKQVACWRATTAVEGDYTIRLTAANAMTAAAYVMVEVNMLAQIQSAIRQDDTLTANPTISTMSPFARLNNGVLAFWQSNAAQTVEAGWQSPLGTPASPGGGWLYNFYWRANADDVPGIGMSGARSGAVAIEIQGAVAGGGGVLPPGPGFAGIEIGSGGVELELD